MGTHGTGAERLPSARGPGDEMRRRDFVLVGSAALVLPPLANAQKKTPVVGFLWTDSVKPSPYVAVLVQALRDKGWVAGRDFQIEDRVTLEGYEAYAESVAQLIQAKVDVIVAWGSTGVFAAAKATKEIPIVMLVGVDPVAAGLVPSLSRPGGNLTGVSTMATALNQKRVELLKELNPRASRIGVVLAANVAGPTYRRESETAARALGLEIHFSEARKAEELERAIAELAKAGIDALYIAPASVFQVRSSYVAALVAKYRLPAVYANERYIDAGALMVYAPSVKKAFIRAAAYVDRILKGTRAAEMAIEQVSDVELVINLKTATALGIKVPQSLLVRADRVIE